MNKLMLILLLMTFMEPCDFEHHGRIVCSDMFAYVSLKVKGKVLDDYYTIRKSTGEEVRYEMYSDSTYTVLNDRYVSDLTNAQDTFIFYGYYRGELVVKENFVIKADECHIQKVSGIDTVEI
jgi:hypothetical protein